MDRRTDGRMDARTDRRTDGQILFCRIFSAEVGGPKRQGNNRALNCTKMMASHGQNSRGTDQRWYIYKSLKVCHYKNLSYCRYPIYVNFEIKLSVYPKYTFLARMDLWTRISILLPPHHLPISKVWWNRTAV